MLLEDNTTAYIVRVWLEQREVEGAPVAWRGSIEHVASGRTKYLTDLDEIARFIRTFLEAMGGSLAERTEWNMPQRIDHDSQDEIVDASSV